MTKQELMNRVTDFEDNFTERKPKGVNAREIRKTIVAFANSVPGGRAVVLYIGVRNDGSLQGVTNPDSLQKTVRNICDQDCFPPIKVSLEVLDVVGKSVVAVAVPSSDNRPHFSGPAYVRRGSESVEASKEMFDELIISRLDKPREILKWKGKIITVIARGKELGSTKYIGDPRYRASHDCRVEDCNPHFVRLFDIPTMRHVSESLDNISILYDESKYRLMLLVEKK